MAFADLQARADRGALQILGSTVRYTPGIGEAKDVLGIFDSAYVKADAGTPGVVSTGPAVWLLQADLPSDPEADLAATVTVGGTTYGIREPKKDSQGGVHLLLYRT